MNFNTIITFSIIFFLLNISTCVKVNAQPQKYTNDLQRFEIAIDLKNFLSISSIDSDKLLFKINRIKDGQIKGAYRFGLGGKYEQSKREGTQDGINYELWENHQYSMFSLLLGYEKHNYINSFNLYYGVDLEQIIGINNYPPDKVGNSDALTVRIIPFVGIKLPIAKHFSTSIELGLFNSLSMGNHNNSSIGPEHNTKNTYFISRISLPYTLSINYNF